MHGMFWWKLLHVATPFDMAGEENTQGQLDRIVEAVGSCLRVLESWFQKSQVDKAFKRWKGDMYMLALVETRLGQFVCFNLPDMQGRHGWKKYEWHELSVGLMGASYNDGTPTWVAGHEGRHATQFPYFNDFQRNQPHLCLYQRVYLLLITYIVVSQGAAGNELKSSYSKNSLITL